MSIFKNQITFMLSVTLKDKTNKSSFIANNFIINGALWLFYSSLLDSFIIIMLYKIVVI